MLGFTRHLPALLLSLILLAASGGCATIQDPLAGYNSDSTSSSVTLLPVEFDVVQTETMVAAATVPEILAHSDPLPDSPVVARLAHPVPTGGPRVFQVLGEEGEWLQVALPIRPNGTTGWIRSADVSLSLNPYRIEIDTGDRVLRVHRKDEQIIETVVAIGTGETPTPIGEFYLTELLRPSDPTGPYGTYAFGLSGFSETLTEFNGGDGVVGIHGTNDPGSLGTDVSHGCVRVENSVIDEMAEFLPLGTPVKITS